MTNLPEGWVLARLDDLLAEEPRAMTDGPFGSNLKSAHYTSTGPRVIRLQNIGDGEFLDEEAHISPERYAKLEAHAVKAGDLVVASLGQELPRACIVPAHVPPAIVKADCIRVRIHPDIDPRYVNYALQRPELRHLVADKVHGVGRPRLGMAGIRALPVPLAPTRARAQIVAAVEEYLSDIDAAEGSLLGTGRNLQRMRNAMLHDLTSGSWPRSRLIDALDSLNNGVFVSRPAPKPPGTPIFRISAVRPLELDLRDVRYADLDELTAAKYRVNEGDVLFTRYSGNPSYVGACAVVPTAGMGVLHPDKLIRGVVRRDRALPEWIAMALAVGDGRREIEKRLKTTAGQVGIAGGQLKQVPIPLPPREEQAILVERWGTAREAIERTGAEVDKNLERVRLLRRSVLASAFSGKLPLDGMDDEVLLAGALRNHTLPIEE